MYFSDIVRLIAAIVLLIVSFLALYPAERTIRILWNIKKKLWYFIVIMVAMIFSIATITVITGAIVFHVQPNNIA